jgi:hypothetical protein
MGLLTPTQVESWRKGRINFLEPALAAAFAAAVRHKHTDYDSLQAAGLDRALARQQVADQVQAILAVWRQ